MSIRTRNNATPWAALFFALLGLAWCGYVAFPTANPAPCATSGCALFRDSRIAGVSLWWIGGAYFFLLAIVCLRGNRQLARLMAMAALFLDSVLLVVMFFTAPCFDCLVVAIFLGLTYYHLRSAGDGWFVAQQAPSLLLPIWFGLFLGNFVLAANEQLPQFAMGNTRSSDVRIYFSPSCNACRAAILASGNAAALYPVEENSGDMDSIIRLGALLKANVPMREALPRSINPDEPVPYLPFYERMLLSVQLMRNKAVVLRQGFRALPMIQINGMPVSKTAPLEEKGEPESSLPQEGRGGPASEGPVYNLAPSYADPAGASDGAGQRHSAAPRSPDAPALVGPISDESARHNQVRQNQAGQTQSGRTGQRVANGHGQTDSGNLPDFLLNNADDLSRCSRASGQPCN